MSVERDHEPVSDPSESVGTGESLKRRNTVRSAKIVAVVVLVLLVVGAGRTVMSRMSNARALEANSVEHGKVYVKTASPKSNDAGQTLALPGTLQGFVQSPIGARASGYVRRWYKDIGSRVAKGELLAEIDAPEIDQQLSQAVAARQQTASSLQLANSTMERWEALRKKDAVSQQELDERRSGDAQARANLAAADANVQRLRQLEGFKRVVAPFAGVITRRNVDVGDLIDAGGGSGRAMFLLSQTDPLRVYVNVPQTYAQLVKPGQEVKVTMSELLGRTFRGEVARTAASIDASTRTMQVEVTLPNRDGVLMPGAYVQVLLPLQASRAMTIPTNALMIRGEGMRVALVDSENRIRLRPIKIGRNYGESLEVIEGVAPTDQLVLNPSDSLAEGDVVAVAPPAKGAPPAKSAEATSEKAVR
ncbi:MAG: efflux transporter periplasmic adaptor subunit [Betaproteobacteria bacterium]|jgi:RND family efflux transporter MFP subunit|nr:efflux transporter periplasmic adaptor subunit [Betaproteobacteria bacterium]